MRDETALRVGLCLILAALGLLFWLAGTQQEPPRKLERGLVTPAFVGRLSALKLCAELNARPWDSLDMARHTHVAGVCCAGPGCDAWWLIYDAPGAK